MKTWASKNNKGYTVIQDATPEVIEYVNSKPRYGKVQANGLILINTTAWIDVRADFEKSEPSADATPEVIKAVEDAEGMDAQASKLNDSKALSDITMWWTYKCFNHQFAGKTVAEANDMIEKRGMEILFSEARKETGAVKAAEKNFHKNAIKGVTPAPSPIKIVLPDEVQ